MAGRTKALEASRPPAKRGKPKPLAAQLSECMSALSVAIDAYNAPGTHNPVDNPESSRAELRPYRTWQRVQDRFFTLLARLCRQKRFTVPELAVLALAQWQLGDGWSEQPIDIQGALLRGLCGLDPDVERGGFI